MRTLITPEGMYALEKRHFASGTPSIVLMRRAADRLAEAFETHFGAFAGKTIAVACGRGNNGGDGYAFSVLAARAGARVTLLTACNESALRGDALTCAQEAFALDIPRLSAGQISEIARPDVWVDALFGIGLNRPLDDFYAALIDRINEDHAAGSRVMAVDAPSGLNLTGGRMMGACVAADVTVTFEYAKTGHYLADGLDQCGLIDVRPLETGLAPDEPIRLIEPRDAIAALPERRRSIHKGSCGHLLIVAGSLGMAGAAHYAARMALRMGTGLVTLACPRSIVPVLQTLVPGAMAVPLPEENGAVSRDAVPVLKDALRGKTAAAVGPGLSRRAAPEIVETILTCGLPAVIDADALNLIAENAPLKALLRPYHVLTPHPGEAARLIGALSNPIEDAKRLHAMGATALLKGASSVVAGESGLTLSASGCGGMATGGSGDVLTGMIGALLAQSVDPETAAWAASELHGLSGETAARALTETAMTASDLIAYWPETLRTLSRQCGRARL